MKRISDILGTLKLRAVLRDPPSQPTLTWSVLNARFFNPFLFSVPDLRSSSLLGLLVGGNQRLLLLSVMTSSDVNTWGSKEPVDLDPGLWSPAHCGSCFTLTRRHEPQTRANITASSGLRSSFITGVNTVHVCRGGVRVSCTWRVDAAHLAVCPRWQLVSIHHTGV